MLPWDEGRMSQSSFWRVELRLRVLPCKRLILSTNAVRDRSEMSPPRASPEEQDAGLSLGPGGQFSLFVGIRSTCILLPPLVAAPAPSVDLERAAGEERCVKALRTRNISDKEILDSSASKEAGAVEEATPMRRELLPPGWWFDGWYGVLFMIIFCGDDDVSVSLLHALHK